MISVYDRTETNFTHNGIILTDVISCEIEEVLNGKYNLELTHPIDEKGKWQYLVEENIIKADGQLFRIYSTEKNLNYIYVFARHIFYDLLHNFLEDVRPTNINGAGALNWILEGTQYPHSFTGTSDIETLNTQYFIRKNPIEAILGPDSLVTRWNGELVRDNFTIKLLSSRGQNKGAQIAYGKNMLGLEVKRDMDSVITRIMPVGREGLLLPEKYIDSPYIGNYVFPRIRKVDFDIGTDEDTTEEQAIENLRESANKLYEINKVDVPYININANLLLLENTEEYKHLKNLVSVGLGDIVSCTDNPLKITFEAKVIRVKKDVLSNKNVEVELGQFKQGISNRLENAIKDISEELQNTTSSLERAIENATNLLTNALGGYVVKRPGELLIMDTEDINTATKVWRWNLNGLGYSNNGINGPYELAMTMDGQIVADFITTGTLNAGLVKAGVLSSSDNTSWINLDNGEFNFKNQLSWDNDKNRLIIGDNSNINEKTEEVLESSPKLTKIDNEGIYTGTIEVDQLKAGIIDTNQIHLKSNDGRLKIIANGIEISHLGGAKTTLDYSGLTVQHRDGDYSIFDSSGFDRYIGGQWQPYKFLSATGMLGDTSNIYNGTSSKPNPTFDTLGVRIVLNGQAWVQNFSNLDVSLWVAEQYSPTSEYWRTSEVVCREVARRIRDSTVEIDVLSYLGGYVLGVGGYGRYYQNVIGYMAIA